jgi:hypothetical protein
VHSTELGETLDTATTRRRVLKIGAKLAYAAPLVAATMKLSAHGVSATAVISGGGDFCGHSTGPNGGCKGACTASGCTGNACNPICGNGQFVGACPVGHGGDNPCCNPGYCNPGNYTCEGGVAVYHGPTAGCPPPVEPPKKDDKKKK